MLFQRFLDDRSGSVLPLLGLAAIPVLGLIGASVDYSRAAAVQTAMQAAVDSTSLAMAKGAASQTAGQLQTNAQTYFNALFTRTDAAAPTVAVSYTTNGGSQGGGDRHQLGQDHVHGDHGLQPAPGLPPPRPPPGATSGCASRSCSTTPGR